jgi:outer membrane receptor protein involved in Fe transport
MTYTGSVWRDFAPLESTAVNYTLNNGASLGAQWDATAKIRVNADVSAERRNYSASPGFNPTGDLRDSLRTGSLRATWSPRPTLQVTAGAAHQARTGSPALGTSSFKSNSVSLSASAQF